LLGRLNTPGSVVEALSASIIGKPNVSMSIAAMANTKQIAATGTKPLSSPSSSRVAERLPVDNGAAADPGKLGELGELGCNLTVACDGDEAAGVGLRGTVLAPVG
jgi:hypothetical protein